MIDKHEAARIVNERFPELKIATVGKIEQGWLFSLESADGNRLRISPILVSEENGEASVFFPPLHLDEMMNYVEEKLD